MGPWEKIARRDWKRRDFEIKSCSTWPRRILQGPHMVILPSSMSRPNRRPQWVSMPPGVIHACPLQPKQNAVIRRLQKMQISRARLPPFRARTDAAVSGGQHWRTSTSESPYPKTQTPFAWMDCVITHHSDRSYFPHNRTNPSASFSILLRRLHDGASSMPSASSFSPCSLDLCTVDGECSAGE
jgi:hypothetical protein